MKNTRTLFGCLAAGLALLALTAPAFAQGGFFGIDDARVIQVAKPALMLYSGTGEGAVTNLPVDTIGIDGYATLIISSATNGASGTLVAQIETGPDQATWWSLTNYALASQTSLIVTNRYYGTNGLTCTNVYFVNGTITTPTAATRGFATPYLNPALYTNVGTTVNIASNQLTFVSFNSQDSSRYIRVNFKPGGSLTNNYTSAVLLTRKNGFP